MNIKTYYKGASFWVFHFTLNVVKIFKDLCGALCDTRNKNCLELEFYFYATFYTFMFTDISKSSIMLYDYSKIFKV